MSDVQLSDRMIRADRLSKVLALVVAMVFFVGSLWLTEAQYISSIAAAGVGIGARFLLPYGVSLTVPEGEGVSIEDHPGTGNYHHGAVGAALLLGSLVMVGVLAETGETNLTLALGLIAMGFLFVIFSELLPRG
jgi:hypothetical protein